MQLNRISDLYWGNTPNLFFLSLLLGILTGICYATLVPFIMYATSMQIIDPLTLDINAFNFFNSPSQKMALTFLYVCLGIIVIKSISHILSVYIAHKSTVVHRIELYKRINALSYASLENIGQARLINILHVDIHNLYMAATKLPFIWISAITVMGTLGYLLYLNERVFYFVLLAILFAIVIYLLPGMWSARYFSRSRAHYDLVQEGAKGLIYGAKELKLNAERSQHYIDTTLIKPENAALHNNLKGMIITTFAEVYGELISFLIIAIVIFHLTYLYEISQLELFGVVVALLYLTGPVGVILGSIGELHRGRISLQRLQDFYKEMRDEPSHRLDGAIAPVNILTLQDIGYRYNASAQNFAVHDINLRFKRGEINFIVGGNGSGKSTLAKLLTLHYTTEIGELRFDDELLTHANIHHFREQVCAIYTDFYLFKHFYKDIDIDLANEWLDILELKHKVSIDKNGFSETSLSDGQRKRLALLNLVLEQRSICLFDEWAADQDPAFKQTFYTRILPKLKEQGKMVIVITHDDRFFHLADQIIVMEDGTVREIKQQCHPQQ